MAVLGPDEIASNSEPQTCPSPFPGPGCFGAVEAVEDEGQVLWWNPGSGVRDAHLGPAIIQQFGNGNSSSRRRMPQSIIQQDRQYLTGSLRVAAGCELAGRFREWRIRDTRPCAWLLRDRSPRSGQRR